MSLARSTYRTLLRTLAQAQSRYADARDVLFALFGVAVQQDELAAAGYGTQPQRIVRRCFERASLADDARDTTAHRLSDAFAVIRALRELHSDRRCGARQRPSRRCVDTAPPSKDEVSALMRDEAAKRMSSRLPRGATGGDGSSSSNSTTTTTTTKSADEESDEDAAFYREHGRVYDAATLVIRIVDTRELKLDTAMALHASKDKLLPYRYLLPPEPMYTSTVCAARELPCLTDVLLAICARAVDSAAASQASSSSLSPSSSSTPVAADSQEQPQRDVMPFTTPRTHAELLALLLRIPTRTRAQTSVVEVEVVTRYLSRVRDKDVADTTRNMYDTLTWCDKDTADATTDSGGSSSCMGVTSASSKAVHTDCSNSSSSNDDNDAGKKDAASRQPHLYSIALHLRNTSAADADDTQHVFVLSTHLVHLVATMNKVYEMVTPGACGNMTHIKANDTHMFESGFAVPRGGVAIVRGTIQVAMIDTEGVVQTLDVAVPPTLLRVPAT